MSAQPMEERIGHLLSRVCELKHRRMHGLLDDLGLYRGQPSVLRVLWTCEGITHSELAEHLNRCPATITKTVQRMEKAGFLERRPDPHDERISRVYLTAAGRHIQAAVENVWHTYEQEAFAGFAETELATLRDMLIRVCQNLERTTCA